MWRRPWLQDSVLALVLVLGCAVINRPGTEPAWWAATLAAAAGVALRRRWPVPMLGLCTAAAAVHIVLGHPLVLADLAMPILLYTVAERCRLRVSLAALGVLMLGAIGWSIGEAVRENPGAGLAGATDRVATVPLPPPHQPFYPPLAPDDAPMIGGPDLSVPPEGDNIGGGLSVLGSVLVAAWAVGSGTRGRRTYLERERDRQAENSAAAERGRISRELHDVVAHGLSVMVVQAQGGAAALDHRPEDTRAALAAIVQIGRRSLADMRHVLGAVTQEPQPGLRDLPNLARQVSDAGIPVELSVDPRPTAIPSTVDFSAYRIVQEALTNTMKHAGTGAHVRVRVSYTEREIQVQVSDDGGSGLRGMRERAALLGGKVTARSSPDGGFVVEAQLPLHGPNT